MVPRLWDIPGTSLVRPTARGLSDSCRRLRDGQSPTRPCQSPGGPRDVPSQKRLYKGRPLGVSRTFASCGRTGDVYHSSERLNESPPWMRWMTSMEQSSHLHLYDSATPGYGVSVQLIAVTRHLQDVYVATIWYSRGRDVLQSFRLILGSKGGV